MKSAHIATLHHRHDTRILLKQCVSLANEGYDVALFVSDGDGDEVFNGVNIVDVGRTGGRVAGRLVPMWRAARQARKFKPDVIHFHDGMFLPFAILLAAAGYRVIYDVHEDYPREVFAWRFSWPVRYAASVSYAVLEWIGGLMFTKILAATPHIARRFPKRKTHTIRNFPLHEELVASDATPYAMRAPHFAYVGKITVDRGIREVVDALPRIDKAQVILDLAGAFDPAALREEIERMPGWRHVLDRGWVGREDIARMLGGARAGLVVLHPRENYLYSYPIKLFEYMAAGLPVIVSDFPLWRHLIGDARCGLFVDPRDPAAIAQAMAWILDNPDEAEAMGERGRLAVEDEYNWAQESRTLLQCYRALAA
ncbi:glycosyl transferase [Hyphomicrobium nitrativorans NL23]|uniref:Glycosyl transferase n=2 Tax=Hyphomicrobium TaxID=81 RepID=V5S9A1_9HYPH|nr:glycosyl transferase [Hyphomicrobium nitrativorans NL23]